MFHAKEKYGSSGLHLSCRNASRRQTGHLQPKWQPPPLLLLFMPPPQNGALDERPSPFLAARNELHGSSPRLVPGGGNGAGAAKAAVFLRAFMQRKRKSSAERKLHGKESFSVVKESLLRFFYPSWNIFLLGHWRVLVLVEISRNMSRHCMSPAQARLSNGLGEHGVSR